ncbi:MAG: NUDIX domain-containing protein [Bacteroidota bacterium]|jgi:8-oxo-dGTP diphosphatase
MSHITVRIYGILIDSTHGLLVSDEFIRGDYFTKLPGGGLEYGEGTRDCLIREFKEETGLDVTVGDHIYTTDFYQPSAFRTGDQILSIYYYVSPFSLSQLQTRSIAFDFKPEEIADKNGQAEHTRWIPLKDLSEEAMSLPIDKIVINKILQAL